MQTDDDRVRRRPRREQPARRRPTDIGAVVRLLAFAAVGAVGGGLLGLVVGGWSARNFVDATSWHPLLPSGDAVGTLLVVTFAGVALGGIAGLYVAVATRRRRRRR